MSKDKPIHPRGCTCIPISYGSMSVPMESGRVVTHTILTRAIRKADCEVHGRLRGPSRYSLKYLRH